MHFIYEGFGWNPCYVENVKLVTSHINLFSDLIYYIGQKEQMDTSLKG